MTRTRFALQRDAACTLQRDAAYYWVVQCVAFRIIFTSQSRLLTRQISSGVLQCVAVCDAVCCSVQFCFVTHCNTLYAVCCSVLQSVMQCVAVCKLLPANHGLWRGGFHQASPHRWLCRKRLAKILKKSTCY